MLYDLLEKNRKNLFYPLEMLDIWELMNIKHPGYRDHIMLSYPYF